ncbi:prion-like-(Q/N-rich) domain-bearing protein 25 [Mya arenaria]|uniref:prion-like-(Q/N-rich) domain-bearing protein 25 n=1 Tax=Mya arenaria TaxID=6604 RepID=UPI0022E5237B|nr:prion-like-(Q/N-rich) domain-bearing protein 25 [Mya arenaria]
MTDTRLLGLLVLLCALVGTLNAVALNGTCTKDTDCSCENPQATCVNAMCKCTSGYTAVSRECKADIGTTCASDGDCNTSTNANIVCDLTLSAPVCKVGAGGDCTNNQNDCVSNSACSTNVCTCTTTTHSADTSTKYCKKALGQSCTATSECESNIAGTVCDTTIDSPVCKLGDSADCSSVSTHCMSHSICNSTCDCDTGYTAVNNLCIGEIGQACTVAGGCPSYAECSTNCACMNGYIANDGNTTCLGDLGSTCTATAECDVTNTDVVCDTAGKCNLKVGGICTGNTDKCVANAACTGTTNTVCECSSGYLADAATLCQQDAGGSCTTDANCGTGLVCDLTLTEPKCRKTLANCGSDTTNCVGNSGCTGTTCTCSTGYTKTISLCVGGIDKSCDTHSDCAATLVCDMAASTKTCKKGDGQACTADQCMTNAECSTCPSCECSAGYSYDSTSVMCTSSEAGTAVLSSLMLAFCLLISVV